MTERLQINISNEIKNGYAAWCRMTPEQQDDLIEGIRPTVEDGADSDPDFALKLIACMNLSNVLLRQHAATKLADMHMSRNGAYVGAIAAVCAAAVVVLWGA